MTEEEIIKKYNAIMKRIQRLRLRVAIANNQIIDYRSELVLLSDEHKKLCPNEYTKKGKLKKRSNFATSTLVRR